MHLQRITMVLIALIFACNVTFNCDAASPTGKWKGSWNSGTTGHKGPLRANVRQMGTDSYKATFSGRFAKVIPFIYSTELKRVPGTCDCYTSTKRLPLLGTYKMQATVGPHRLRAVFQGKKDKGIFELSR